MLKVRRPRVRRVRLPVGPLEVGRVVARALPVAVDDLEHWVVVGGRHPIQQSGKLRGEHVLPGGQHSAGQPFDRQARRRDPVPPPFRLDHGQADEARRYRHVAVHNVRQVGARQALEETPGFDTEAKLV